MSKRFVVKQHKHERLVDVAYEDYYVKALAILREKYDFVGHPYQKDGNRVCQIERLAADDHTVFLPAWGTEMAYELQRGHVRVTDAATKPRHNRRHSRYRSAGSGI
jgi:hypothetical protein